MSVSPSLGDFSPVPTEGAADALIGQTVMGYTVERVLGTGAMGVVYEGKHRLGGRAAIKLMHVKASTDPLFREQLERETRILFKLDNTHLVKAFGYEALPDGRHCLLMAFHDNTPLDEVMRRADGSLPLPTALAYAYQMLDGLEAAHGAGIWHRDLKPSNVLELKESIQVDGITYPLLKIVDFGIGYDSAHSTLDGEHEQLSAGTPSYLSPEQASARPTDARSDLYSFGVVLFQMVSGELPFDADTDVAVMKKHISARPPLLRALAMQAPEDLETLVAQLLEKDPEKRPQSASAVKHEVLRLLKAIHGERTQVSPVPVAPAETLLSSTLVDANNTGVDRIGVNRTVPIRRARLWPWAVLGGGVLLGVGVAGWQMIRGASPCAARRAEARARAGAGARTGSRARPGSRAPGRCSTAASAAAAGRAAAASREGAGARGGRRPAAAQGDAPTAEGPPGGVCAVHARRELEGGARSRPAGPDEARRPARLPRRLRKRERELTPAVQVATPQTCGPIGAQIEALFRRYHRPRETPTR